MMKPKILALLLLFVQFVHFGFAATLFEDYEQCREQAHFGRPNGTLVCDPESRLQPKAVAQLEGMLRDLEKNVPCDCEGGCARADTEKGEQFMALLGDKFVWDNKLDCLGNFYGFDRWQFQHTQIVSNNERIEQSGGMDALNGTAKRIWDDAAMGDEHCDNGMLLIYLRDKRQMATYQGHASGHDRFKVFSDQEIANLHDLAMRAGPNGTADVSALPLGDFGNSGGGGGGVEEKDGDDSVGTEVRRAAESWAPVVGLSIALALTFLVLIILLALLCAKCCRLCCPSRARKTSKYYVNPMPSYKSIEPIYIVTPAGSEAAGFAPPSGASLYGTGTYGHHHHPAGPTTRPPPIFHPHAVYGPPPPPPPPPGPLVHQPHSRSVTPTSTQRIHRTYHPSGSGIRTAQQSIHSTPEANKRDKVNRTMTVRSNGTGTFYTATSSQQPTPEIMATHGNGGGSNKKKLSHPPSTIHETHQMPSSSIEQQQFHHQSPSNLSHPPPPLPFLDPWRKQEVQTREEFIG